MVKTNHVVTSAGKYQNIRYKNSKYGLYCINISANKGKYLNKVQIEALANKYVKQQHDAGRRFKVSIAIKSDITDRWTSSYQSLSSDKIKMPEINEEDYDDRRDLFRLLTSETRFKKFVIMLREYDHKEADGNDEHNNCVWKVLNTVFNGEFPKNLSKINKPIKFKKFFGLEQDDKFPKSKLKDLADLIQCQIQVYGDKCEVYGDYGRIIKMKSLEGHMTQYIDTKYNHEDNVDVNGIPVKPKKEVVVFDTDTWSTFSQDGYKENQKEYIRSVQKVIKYNGDVILVHSRPNLKNMMLLPKDATLKDVYKRFIMIANNLKSVSKDYIDLYQCGSEFANYALYLFNKSLRVKYQSDHIDAQEAQFLNNSGGLMYCREQYKGHIYHADINKAYPWAMINKISVPVYKPKYSTFDQSLYLDKETQKEFFPFGMYKCVIEKSGDPIKDSIFHFSKVNKYTHFDLTRAREMGLNIIMSEGINCALYSGGRIHGRDLFEQYFEPLIKAGEDFRLKPESRGILKHIRNILYGVLSQKNTRVLYADKEGIIDIDEDIYEEISRAPRKGRDEILDVKVRVRDQPFKTQFARLGSFITGFLRNHLSREIEKIGAEKVIRANVDGIYSKEPMGLRDSDYMGDWKLKEGLGEITKVNNKVFPEYTREKQADGFYLHKEISDVNDVIDNNEIDDDIEDMFV